MSYRTRIVGETVEVTSSRTRAVHAYKIPAGMNPDVYALRCAERARVSECLSAVFGGGQGEAGRHGRPHILRR